MCRATCETSRRTGCNQLKISPDPLAIAPYGPLETEDRTRRLEIETLRPAKDHFVVRFCGVADRDAAEALRNVNLYIERDRLPVIDDDTFYHADLIGLAAVTKDGDPIGTVAAIHNFGAGDIIELRLASGGELLLPFNAATIPQVDLANGHVVVDPPVDAAED